MAFTGFAAGGGTGEAPLLTPKARCRRCPDFCFLCRKLGRGAILIKDYLSELFPVRSMAKKLLGRTYGTVALFFPSATLLALGLLGWPEQLGRAFARFCMQALYIASRGFIAVATGVGVEFGDEIYSASATYAEQGYEEVTEELREGGGPLYGTIGLAILMVLMPAAAAPPGAGDGGGVIVAIH